jgi:cytochrome bd-type quinol oxidase subunit 2
MLDVIKRKSARNVPPILALVVAVLGGIFLGLFSCGGYVWHRQLIYLLLSVSVVLVLFVPTDWLKTRTRRVLFVVAIACLFAVVQSVASTFYPASPKSASEFTMNFLRALWYGPC